MCVGKERGGGGGGGGGEALWCGRKDCKGKKKGEGETRKGSRGLREVKNLSALFL